MLESCKEGQINIDCVDPLGRSALLMAIDNENLEMVELLLENKVRLITVHKNKIVSHQLRNSFWRIVKFMQ